MDFHRLSIFYLHLVDNLNRKDVINLCTAITFTSNNNSYFGRTFDLEKRFEERVTVTPRNYIFRYSMGEVDRRHFAIIGTATIMDRYPLYYDATNEFGLSMAGLNFVGNTYFSEKEIDGRINLAPYELIPYMLSKYKSCLECLEVLKTLHLVDKRFRNDIPNSELHWLISDGKDCLTLEISREGTKTYNNSVGVLTNNPGFNQQMLNLSNYMSLTNEEPVNKFASSIEMPAYSRGMGAIGLPGDNSSMSRFVRASYTKMNSSQPADNRLALVQAFHILSSVEQQEGSVIFNGQFERTQYTSCCDIKNGIYYYKTYENSQIAAVNMFNENLEGEELISYRMRFEPNIEYIN